MTRYSDSLLAASKAAVAARIRQPAGVERHAVFNPLSWTRTDVVDLASDVPEPRYVVDVGTGATLRSQTVVVDGAPRLRVRVTGVPSIGYRVLEVRPGPGLEFPPAATVTLPVMDNGIYRVTVGSRGQITSLLDHKDGNRELVLAGGSLNDLGSNTGSGAIVLESAGPVSATIKVAAATPMRRDIRSRTSRTTRTTIRDSI
jgi:alpha-mannosidase